MIHHQGFEVRGQALPLHKSFPSVLSKWAIRMFLKPPSLSREDLTSSKYSLLLNSSSPTISSNFWHSKSKFTVDIWKYHRNCFLWVDWKSNANWDVVPVTKLMHHINFEGIDGVIAQQLSTYWQLLNGVQWLLKYKHRMMLMTDDYFSWEREEIRHEKIRSQIWHETRPKLGLDGRWFCAIFACIILSQGLSVVTLWLHLE